METIIVQETDSDVLDILTYALQIGGYNIYPLLSCDENFLGIIEQTKPHVVILDFKLKGKECIRVLREIKIKYPHLPVIASSCNSNINEDYDLAGFDDYITKPFDLEDLYLTLRKHIPNSRYDVA
ncbi:response regulator [Mucilaginibacter sp. E4BP6]|uniref:response regulator n=1 Tax=Mucilaginibacter sp. E4BP6 TaxID=2723089 RepID=UPI0015CB420E|nr:response regulator [Mucilaginibacter sp. E4BP6]NYE67828.1 DNA-binding response OmpR family regulator [Mucilaginibacter sp. E4BP6]